MVLSHVIRLDENSVGHFNSGHTTGSKAPVYISDKRAKFSRRLNKKWVRVLTVIGYLISICIPAMALSVYYLAFWDPQYKTKILANETVYVKDEMIEAKLLHRRTVSHPDDEKTLCPPCFCKLKTLNQVLMAGVSEPNQLHYNSDKA